MWLRLLNLIQHRSFFPRIAVCFLMNTTHVSAKRLIRNGKSLILHFVLIIFFKKDQDKSQVKTSHNQRHKLNAV